MTLLMLISLIICLSATCLNHHVRWPKLSTSVGRLLSLHRTNSILMIRLAVNQIMLWSIHLENLLRCSRLLPQRQRKNNEDDTWLLVRLYASLTTSLTLISPIICLSVTRLNHHVRWPKLSTSTFIWSNCSAALVLLHFHNANENIMKTAPGYRWAFIHVVELTLLMLVSLILCLSATRFWSTWLVVDQVMSNNLWSIHRCSHSLPQRQRKNNVGGAWL